MVAGVFSLDERMNELRGIAAACGRYEGQSILAVMNAIIGSLRHDAGYLIKPCEQIIFQTP